MSLTRTCISEDIPPVKRDRRQTTTTYYISPKHKTAHSQPPVVSKKKDGILRSFHRRELMSDEVGEVLHHHCADLEEN